MRRQETYEEFQRRMFQSMRDMADTERHQFVIEIGKKAGFSGRQIERMFDSGQNSEQILATIISKIKGRIAVLERFVAEQKPSTGTR